MKFGRTMVIISWVTIALWVVFFVMAELWSDKVFSLVGIVFLLVVSPIIVIVNIFAMWSKAKYLKLTTALLILITFLMAWLLNNPFIQSVH